MDRIAKHRAVPTLENLAKDATDGVMEGFDYWDRNGRHRAEESA